jgi:hypothetical protein
MVNQAIRGRDAAAADADRGRRNHVRQVEPLGYKVTLQRAA